GVVASHRVLALRCTRARSGHIRARRALARRDGRDSSLSSGEARRTGRPDGRAASRITDLLPTGRHGLLGVSRYRAVWVSPDSRISTRPSAAIISAISSKVEVSL